MKNKFDEKPITKRLRRLLQRRQDEKIAKLKKPDHSFTANGKQAEFVQPNQKPENLINSLKFLL